MRENKILINPCREKMRLLKELGECLINISDGTTQAWKDREFAHMEVEIQSANYCLEELGLPEIAIDYEYINKVRKHIATLEKLENMTREQIKEYERLKKQKAALIDRNEETDRLIKRIRNNNSDSYDRESIIKRYSEFILEKLEADRVATTGKIDFINGEIEAL